MMKRCGKCDQALNGPEQEWTKMSHMNYCGDCFEKLILQMDEIKMHTCTPICKVCGKKIPDEHICYMHKMKGIYCIEDLIKQIEARIALNDLDSQTRYNA